MPTSAASNRLSKGGFTRRAVSLTPLIDVIFLLLLFFMLSSTFSRFGEIEIAATGGGAVAGDVPPVFMQLREDGLTVNGTAFAQEDAPGAIEELYRLEGEGATNVILSVRAGPDSQALVDILAAIRAGTKLRLSIVR